MGAAAKEQDTHTARMRAAFEIVANPADWRAPIDYSNTLYRFDDACMARGVCQNDVVDAIMFFTATKASVRIVPMSATRPTWIEIKAVGYRNGPAGP